MRKSLMLFMALTICLCSVLSVSASTDGGKRPLLRNTDSVSVTLNISSGTASCRTLVKGKKGISKITIKMKLQKYSNGTWSDVQTWTSTKNSNSFTLSKSKAISKGTYRVISTVKVYKGKDCETLTRDSKQVKY